LLPSSALLSPSRRFWGVRIPAGLTRAISHKGLDTVDYKAWEWDSIRFKCGYLSPLFIVLVDAV
jgi:hypothetical protein